MTEALWKVPVTEAVLRVIDPRWSAAERGVATEVALTGDPRLALGVLALIVEDYHERAERVAGLTAGTMVDRLRAKLIGDSEDDVLGVALSDAAAGDSARVLMPATGSRRPAAQPDGDGSGVFGGPERRAEADNASPAVSAGRAVDERLRAEGDDLAARIEATRQRFEREVPGAMEMVGGATQLAALGARLEQTRAAEAAAAELEGGDDLRASTGHPCNVMTLLGPCGLRSGHPAGPGLPGENGHIGGVA